MEKSSETQESAKPVPDKIDLNRFPVTKYSRWTDEKGRLMVLTGFEYGKDPTRLHSTGWDRTGVELLIVHEEKVKYMDFGRFVHFIIHKKLLPWKDQDLTIINQKPEF
jgi:hypothetical protein